jgi:hypothetical protein
MINVIATIQNVQSVPCPIITLLQQSFCLTLQSSMTHFDYNREDEEEQARIKRET